MHFGVPGNMALHIGGKVMGVFDGWYLKVNAIIYKFFQEIIRITIEVLMYWPSRAGYGKTPSKVLHLSTCVEDSGFDLVWDGK